MVKTIIIWVLILPLSWTLNAQEINFKNNAIGININYLSHGGGIGFDVLYMTQIMTSLEVVARLTLQPSEAIRYYIGGRTILIGQGKSTLHIGSGIEYFTSDVYRQSQNEKNSVWNLEISPTYEYVINKKFSLQISYGHRFRLRDHISTTLNHSIRTGVRFQF